MRIRIKWKNVFLALLFIIFLEVFILSSIKIVKWYIDSKNTVKEIKKINYDNEINEVEDSDNTEIINNGDKSLEDPYWDYIKMNLIDVDFTKLKEKNSKTVGWIQVSGTTINYPFVQGDDNEYYLTHSFNNSYNEAGWVFLDYRNKILESDRNTIIYAHGRMDTTMFGSLRKILTSGWLNNIENHVIKLSTESENTLWQVFSVYKIPTTNDYIQIDFLDDEYLSFLNMLKERSQYSFNTGISVDDKILTLSTCYDDNDKVVLHAKLIKREKK